VGRPKVRHRKRGDCRLVGRQIRSYKNLEALELRTPHRQGVVCAYNEFEYVLDHVFDELGLGDCSSLEQHPILLSEVLCSTNFSRAHCSEILFECYRAPRVAYGVDALFAWNHHMNSSNNSNNNNNDDNNDDNKSSSSESKRSSSNETGLIVNASHHATFVIPVIAGVADHAQSSRIDVGAETTHDFLHQLWTLKYPQHRQAWGGTGARARELVERFACFAPFGVAALTDKLQWSDIVGTHKAEAAHVLPQPVVLQLPFEAILAERKRAKEQAEAVAARRAQSTQRLRDLGAKARAESLAKNQATLFSFEQLLKERTDGTVTERQFLAELKRGGFAGEQDFLLELKKVREKIARAMKRNKELDEKAAAGTSKAEKKGVADDDDADEAEAKAKAAAEALLPAEQRFGTPEFEAKEFPLIHVADAELTPDALADKRRQMLRKAGLDYRKRRSIEKAAARAAKKQRDAAEAKRRTDDPAAYCAQLRARRQRILTQRSERRRRKKASSSSQTRGSSASRKRMTTLAKLGSETMSDNFGKDDDDWAVYRDVANVSADDEQALAREQAEFDMLHGKLMQYDAAFRKQQEDAAKARIVPVEQRFQLEMFVERVRVPELLYNPMLFGVNQAGLGETIGRILQRYPKATQAAMARNVLATGGLSLVPGFTQRLRNEIVQLRPEGSAVHVRRSGDPIRDAWRGAAQLARTVDFDAACCFTRKEYEECGPDYLKEHRCSNQLIKLDANVRLPVGQKPKAASTTTTAAKKKKKK
jgi:actin-related protein 5